MNDENQNQQNAPAGKPNRRARAKAASLRRLHAAEAAERETEENEKAENDERARMEIERSRLSVFDRAPVAPRLVPRYLSFEQREHEVAVFFDFENAMKDFPPGFDMFRFSSVLQRALRAVFGINFVVLEIYGAGTPTAFWNVKNGYSLHGHPDYNLITDIEERESSCGITNCGNQTSRGRRVNYERTSDSACDAISTQMSDYPTSVGHTQNTSCNVLVITGDRDLGSAMIKLKLRGVRVMLAYTGAETARANSYLLTCASQNSVMKFRRDVFHR